jgi:hypothetical protein
LFKIKNKIEKNKKNKRRGAKPERLEELLSMPSMLPSSYVDKTSLVLYDGKIKFPGLNVRLAEVKL